jgi:hypothetical protein
LLTLKPACVFFHSYPHTTTCILYEECPYAGVDGNNWRADTPRIPDAYGPCNNSPTVFSVLKAQMPNATSALVTGWPELVHFAHPAAHIDFIESAKTARDVVEKAVSLWNKHAPTLLFIHVDDVDHAGMSK